MRFTFDGFSMKPFTCMACASFLPEQAAIQSFKYSGCLRWVAPGENIEDVCTRQIIVHYHIVELPETVDE